MKNISCPGCGHTNLWDSKFCENCGCDLSVAKTVKARHGSKFKSKEFQDYFNSKSCYQGIYSPKQWDKKGDNYFFNQV